MDHVKTIPIRTCDWQYSRCHCKSRGGRKFVLDACIHCQIETKKIRCIFCVPKQLKSGSISAKDTSSCLTTV